MYALRIGELIGNVFSRISVIFIRTSCYRDDPPQITICWPVIAAASSDNKNAVTAATSSGWTKRPIGGRRGGTPLRPVSRSIGVSVALGDTTFTVMPRGASSMAHDRAMPTSADLVATYWLRPAAPEAVRLPISTIRPPRGRFGV